MSKRFFYVSLGVLALAIAWHLGARSARGDWDTSGLGSIGGVQGPIWWAHSGEAYRLEAGGSWTRDSGYDLPSMTGQVELTGEYPQGIAVATSTDEVFLHTASGWFRAQPFPGSGTATEKTSWGGFKKQFKQ